MSLTLNMVGGGSGGISATDALLRVQAPTGSSVTIVKGATTKTGVGHENADDNSVYEFYFVIRSALFDSITPWTVTATVGNLVSSDTVIIDAPNGYNVTLHPLVPSGYQAVEYIQSSGTQYINTGVNPISTRWGFDMDMMPLNTIGSNNGYSFFGQKAASSNEYHLNAWSYASGYNGTLVMKGSAYAAGMTQNVRQQMSMHSRVFTNASGTALTVVNGSLGNLPLFLFACNFAGSASENSSMRLYGFKMYDASDTLVADLAPCYRTLDSVVGLFDVKRETFLTNAGSGTFTVGADVI